MQNKSLKALAVTSLKRVPDFPDVATLVEQGMPAFEAVGWTALVGPAHLAPETVEKLNHLVNDFLASEEGKAALAKLGMEALGGTPQDLADYMASELIRWQPVAEKVTVE
jgi:tripartite-type tricarboxylate transporter receptor subunit TctC